jgi:hypothetical protein
VLGDRARAEVLYRMLEPYAARHVQVGLAIHWGSIERYLGLLASTRGDLAAAEEHHTRALERHAAIASPLLTAVARCDLAAVLWARGQDRRAPAHAQEAEAFARARGLSALRERAAALRHEGTA